MGTQYLIDTNIVIGFLSGNIPDSGNQWVQKNIEQDLLWLSVINQIELLGFNGPANEMQALQEFIDASNVLPLSKELVSETIRLRRSYKIKLPDAIIAATALVHGLVLLTRNTRDFEKIEKLELINPFDI